MYSLLVQNNLVISYMPCVLFKLASDFLQTSIEQTKTLWQSSFLSAWSLSRIGVTFFFFAIRWMSKHAAGPDCLFSFLCISCNQVKETSAIFVCYYCVVRTLTDRYINLQRSVGLPELRSLRRTFIKLAGQYSLSGRPPPTDADSAKRMFVDYLNREISGWWFYDLWRVTLPTMCFPRVKTQALPCHAHHLASFGAAKEILRLGWASPQVFRNVTAKQFSPVLPHVNYIIWKYLLNYISVMRRHIWKLAPDSVLVVLLLYDLIYYLQCCGNMFENYLRWYPWENGRLEAGLHGASNFWKKIKNQPSWFWKNL